jgi:hypothetical protein
LGLNGEFQGFIDFAEFIIKSGILNNHPCPSPEILRDLRLTRRKLSFCSNPSAEANGNESLNLDSSD